MSNKVSLIDSSLQILAQKQLEFKKTINHMMITDEYLILAGDDKVLLFLNLKDLEISVKLECKISKNDL